MADTADRELMRRAKAGDEAAFAGIVRRYQDVLLNFFLRAAVSFTDGEDLVQRTFLRIWRYRRRYRPEGAKFTTFLFLVARQVLIDFFRAEQTRRKQAENLSRQVEADLRTKGVSSAPSEGVVRALGRLTPQMRETVELVVFQDMPYAEASAVLGVPTGTVKSRLHNALEKLRGWLRHE